MQYYDTISNGYNELHGSEQKEKAGIIKKNLKMRGLLLDVGSGTGISTAEFRDCCKCIALDISIQMLRKCHGMRVCARAEQLPFKDNCFDSVVSITALHHCDLEKAFPEIERVAKKGASIAITFFKRSPAINDAKRFLNGFKRVDSRFDAIFLRE